MPDLNNSEIQLLISYVKDECTEKERNQVEEWLESDASHREIFSEVKHILETLSEEKINWDVEGSWKRFQAKYDLFNDTTNNQSGNSPKKSETLKDRRGSRRRGLRYSVAAGFILALIAVSWLIEQPSESDNQAKVKEFIAEKGERISVTLKDGSKVMLNANSSLKVAPNYNEDSRMVNLNGEAFFEVEHDENKPFTVKARDVYTKVLGTKFNIRSYSSDQSVRVVVAEGKVEVGRNSNTENSVPRVLDRSHMGIINHSGDIEVAQIDDASLFTGWRNGKLVFNKSSFSEVREELERWYNIDTSVSNNNLDNKQLSASFNDEPLLEVLEVISVSLQMDYTMNNDQVTFTEKNINRNK